jgi:hypothetical protein
MEGTVAVSVLTLVPASVVSVEVMTSRSIGFFADSLISGEADPGNSAFKEGAEDYIYFPRIRGIGLCAAR